MTQPTQPNPAQPSPSKGDIDPEALEIDTDDVAEVLPDAHDEDFVAPGEADAPAPG